MKQFINRLQQMPALTKWGLFLLLFILFIPHWIAAWHTIQNSIAPDLLLRTIGTRLQQAGKPIYQYKWQTGDPIAWLNPYADRRAGINGVVSTPFFLWLQQPFAKLSYCTIRLTWGCLQEVFLFATTFLCCLLFRNRFSQFFFIAIALAGFVYDRNWMLHLYNGQVYILYAFVFAVSAYLLVKYKGEKKLLILFPLISVIRPFFITSVLPYFRLKKQSIAYFSAALLAAALMVLSTTSTNEWKQYSGAMKIYAKEQSGDLLMDAATFRISPAIFDPCTKNSETAFRIFGAGCLFSLQHYLTLVGIRISTVLVFQAILVITILLVWWIAYKKNWLHVLPKQLILSFLVYQLCELLTPASRNPYNMIQWLPVIAWLVTWGNKQTIWLILAGLCLNHDIPFWFKYEREIGEILLFVAAGLFLFQKNNSELPQVS